MRQDLRRWLGDKGYTARGGVWEIYWSDPGQDPISVHCPRCCARWSDMTKDDLDRWLETYGRAWVDRDPDAAARLFSEDVSYHETPFDEPARGIDGVRRYWAENTDVQRDVRFRYQVLAVDGPLGIARWWAEYVRPATKVRAELDGMFVLEFAADGRCRRLEEWWHRREAPVAPRDP